MSRGLNELRNSAFANATEKGFYEEPRPSFGDRIALIHSELSEALEDFRAGRGPSETYYQLASGHEVPTFTSSDGSVIYKPCGVPSELADVIIRVLDFCGEQRIDIEKAVEEKMAYNATRPHRHGGKKL
jgi:NTP pyrophosphatase (non-canonical NTP hydrolase)